MTRHGATKWWCEGKMISTLFDATALVVWPMGAIPEKGPARPVRLILTAMSRFLFCRWVQRKKKLMRRRVVFLAVLPQLEVDIHEVGTLYERVLLPKGH